jgi:MYXO-CTERM domain-containing protein
LLGLPGAGEPLSEQELHADLERAKTAANTVERALLEADPVKARAALLPLIGPSISERRHAATPATFSQFRDIVATRIVRRLARLDDLDGVLEAWSRMWTGEPRLAWPTGFDEARFLAAAEDTNRAEHLRIAAIEIVRVGVGSRQPTTPPRLIVLLGDASAKVRAHVVRAVQNREPAADVANALVTAWEKEQDHQVQHALLVAAAQRDLMARFKIEGRPELVVTARSEQDVVDIGYAALAPARWSMTRAAVALKQNGTQLLVLDLVSSAAPNAWGSGHYGGARVRMLPKQPLPPGTYTLSLTVDLLEVGGKTHKADFELAPWVIAEPPPAPVPAPPPPAQESAAVEVLSEFPPPQLGCACRAGGRQPGSGWWLVALALVALRRRHRGL